MSMTAKDVTDCIDGTSEDKLVALIRAIYEAKQKKGDHCGTCSTSPCCCAPVACGGCESSPCCCSPCTPNIGDYLLELGKLNMCFYEQLWEVNRRFHKTLSDAVCAPKSCAPACCGGCGESPCCCGPKEIQKTLCLHGQVGHKAIGKFTLSNQSRNDREVSFLLGEFRGHGKTGARFVPAFEFTLTDGEGELIADRILKKGDTATVTLQAPLWGDFEAPGKYEGTVVVKGAGTMHLHLSIEVEEPDPTPVTP